MLFFPSPSAIGQVPSVLTYPMHGQTKLSSEGYRTRDGHVIEWLGRLMGNVTVVSRPEPFPLAARPLRGRPPVPGTRSIRTNARSWPISSDRRRWWPQSTRWYPELPEEADDVPAIVWNPFLAVAPGRRNPFTTRRTVVLDLLDDWTRHFAFASIRPEVDDAYRAAFERADLVTANGEGTADLARRFGRDDVTLLLNGCDPDIFSATSLATGRTVVGYVGKMGRRLDLDGILTTVRALPEVDFRFAGPVLDRGFAGPLRRLPNVTLLGDVPYDRVPSLLQSFDIGWVPHRVGDGEVGGDVIKTYEYRAAGLPVLSTQIDGAGTRGLRGTTALPVGEHVSVIRTWTKDGPRVPRRPAEVPEDVTWRFKATTLLRMLDRSDHQTAGSSCVS